jgi:hypothetical protein
MPIAAVIVWRYGGGTCREKGWMCVLDHSQKEGNMPVAKVIEISSTSKEGFEDAIRQGIEKASKTAKNIKGAWVKEFHVDVEDQQIVDFRVDMKVTFVLSDS